MPRIQPSTIEAVARTLDGGASIVAPFYEGQRGHPVGFGAEHREALMSLDGDSGARSLLMSPRVVRLDVDDAGVLRDVDSRRGILRGWGRVSGAEVVVGTGLAWPATTGSGVGG